MGLIIQNKISEILLNTALLKTSSFLSSVSLISLYFFLAFKDTYIVTAIIQLYIVIAATLYLLVYFRAIFKHPELSNIETIEIIEVNQDRSTALNYLLANTLPILVLSSGKIEAVTICCILVCFWGVTYYKNDLFYINPILTLLNKYTYTAKVRINKSSECKEMMIVSNQKIYNFNSQFTKQYARVVVKNNIVLVDKVV